MCAYNLANEKQHAFKQFQEDIKKEEIKNLVFLYGNEIYLVDWAIDALISRYINPNTKDFDFVSISGNQATYENVKAASETLPFGSERKIVLVENANLFGLEEKEQKDFTDLFGNLSEDLLLVFVSDSIDSRKKIYKQIIEIGQFYDFKALDQLNFKKFLEKRIKASGKTLKPSVLSEIILKTGYLDKNSSYTLYDIENDLKKIIDHSGDTEILMIDINQMITGNIEKDVFALVDSILRGKNGYALKLLNNLFYLGENEYRLLSLICSQIEKLLMIKELLEVEENQKEIVKITGISEYGVKKNVEIAKRYSISQIRQLLLKAYNIDRDIKSGSMDKKLALELFASLS